MESVLRGLTIYVILFVVIRFSGRRTLAEMTPFDLVLILIIAETTQQALLGDDFSLTNAVVLILTLTLIDIALSYLKQSSGRLALWLDGTPTILIEDGKLDQHAMKQSRVEEADILEAARQLQGLETLAQVKHAVLETNGAISIIPFGQSEQP
jgi:uncharacterized membrane protein YcaP (DUF421 family)